MDLSRIFKHLKFEHELEIFEYSGFKEIDSRIVDIGVKLCANTKVTYGRGITCDKDLSLKKAIYESIERQSVFLNNIDNSNGVAIGETHAFAMNAAKKELIERHIFLYHWLNCISFSLINNELTSIYKNSHYFKNEKNLEISFHTSNLFKNADYFIICQINGLSYFKSFGGYLGMAYKNSLIEAVNHSFYEAANSYLHDVSNKTNHINMSLDFFRKKTSHNFKDHALLAKNSDYFSEIKSKYFSDSDIKEHKLVDLNSISKSIEFISLDVLDNLPLFCVKAISGKIFELKTGIISNEILPHPFD